LECEWRVCVSFTDALVFDVDPNPDVDSGLLFQIPFLAADNGLELNFEVRTKPALWITFSHHCGIGDFLGDLLAFRIQSPADFCRAMQCASVYV